jgi:hypothetical protein
VVIAGLLIATFGVHTRYRCYQGGPVSESVPICGTDPDLTAPGINGIVPFRGTTPSVADRSWPARVFWVCKLRPRAAHNTWRELAKPVSNEYTLTGASGPQQSVVPS